MSDIRKEIDRIDESLIKTLAERQRWVEKAVQVRCGVLLMNRLMRPLQISVNRVRGRSAGAVETVLRRASGLRVPGPVSLALTRRANFHCR